MAKISGYQGKILISFDGKNSWYSVKGITSKGAPNEVSTEDVQTFDDNGQSNEEAVGSSFSVSLEGYVEQGTTAYETLVKKSFARDFVTVKIFRNKADTSYYTLANMWVSSTDEGQEIGAKTTYSLSLNAFGKVITVGAA